MNVLSIRYATQILLMGISTLMIFFNSHLPKIVTLSFSSLIVITGLSSYNYTKHRFSTTNISQNK